jgi:hypothetical protein
VVELVETPVGPPVCDFDELNQRGTGGVRDSGGPAHRARSRSRLVCDFDRLNHRAVVSPFFPHSLSAWP